jgi:hypothetical protein
MEAYRKQTQKIVKSFLAREITFPECVAALDHALARFIRKKMLAEELPNLRAVMMANNETLMQEMERREQKRVQGRRYRKAKLKIPDAQN